jgi:hypothetical protein
VASKHSYKITLSNNATEKDAIQYLLSVDERFLLPTPESRKRIMEVLGIDKRYSRTFDIFMLPGYTNKDSEAVINDGAVENRVSHY